MKSGIKTLKLGFLEQFNERFQTETPETIEIKYNTSPCLTSLSSSDSGLEPDSLSRTIAKM